jgi:hypothetical protein
MKVILFLFVLITLFNSPIYATEYRIGTGQTYPNCNTFATAVGWHNLGAGDVVYIYYRPEPYREFVLLSGNGTASQPIRLVGVPGPNGELPIFDGENAVQSDALQYFDKLNFDAEIDGIDDPDPNDPNIYTYYGGGLYNFGLITVARALGTDWLASPSYISIENIEVRNANQNYQFTPHFAGQVPFTQAYQAVYNQNQRYYASFIAGIRVQRGQHISIKNCVVHNNGNGLFVNSIAWDNPPMGIWNANDNDLTSSDILIEHNSVYKNGCDGGFSCHNIYVEANAVTYQYNYIGGIREGVTLGNATCLKDRSAGTIVRYNYMVADGVGHILDLVEAEASAILMTNAPKYDSTFVYGNIFINLPSGSITLFHYGGDHQDYSIYRRGTLFFYNNTLLNIADQSTRYSQKLFLLPESNNTGIDPPVGNFDEKVMAYNNIFYSTPETATGAMPETYLVQTDGTCELNFVNNYITPNFINGFNYTWNNNTNTFEPFVGTVNLLNVLNNASNNPGFTDFDNGDYTLLATAICTNAGNEALNTATMPTQFQYQDSLYFTPRVSNMAMDLGAMERLCVQPIGISTNTPNPCESNTVAYSIAAQPAGTQYIWQTSSNGTILSAMPYNNSILVKWDAGNGAGEVQVSVITP